MKCSLCLVRKVSDEAARECERREFRLICSGCLTEHYRRTRAPEKVKPKVWPTPVMGAAIRMEFV